MKWEFEKMEFFLFNLNMNVLVVVATTQGDVACYVV
jgi:hypothetical protein